MPLEIVTYGHPVLRKKGKKIAAPTPEILRLAEDMLDTMEAAHGIGLAAQQIGEALMLAVIDVTGADRPSQLWFAGMEVNPEDFMPLVLINPVIEPFGPTRSGPEGCLSFPGMGGNIVRHERVRVNMLSTEGKTVRFEAAGLLGIAIQHEVDHLNGTLFIDRMIAKDKIALKEKLHELETGTRTRLGLK
ncbi:MAG: peptide deformylase [Verrucomicrobiae bacterium]|nr:peptide deformylase [Verrucomicrobiae bacterium]